MRGVIGLSSSIPVVPALGIGVPAAAIPAGLLLPLKRASRPRLLLPLVFVAFLSSSVTTLSAILHETDPATAPIGHAVAFVISLLAFQLIMLSVSEAASFVFWFYLGQLLYVLVFLPDDRVYDLGLQGFWKFGVGTPVVILITYLVIRFGARELTLILTLLCIGAISFGLEFRALGVACFATVAVMVVRRALGAVNRLSMLVVAAGSMYVLAELLQRIVLLGVFGQEVARRTAAQVEGGGPAILGGRSESPLSIAAILERFWLGWGNAQEIDSGTLAKGVRIANALGMDRSDFMIYWIREDGFISLHSILLGTWVEGGVIAAGFPIAILVMCGAACVYASGRWSPLVVLLSVKTGWDVVFSPYSGNRGIQLALVMIIAMLVIESAREKGSPFSRMRRVGGRSELERSPLRVPRAGPTDG